MPKSPHRKSKVTWSQPEEYQPKHPMWEEAYEAKQCRRWTWTMWDEPHDDLVNFSYIAFQQERCPSTGRIHFQGYCETKLKKTRSAVMMSLWGQLKGKHFWCAPSKGTAAQNKEYCSKLESREGDFYERGVAQQDTLAHTLATLTEEIRQTGRLPRVTKENAAAIAFHLPKLQGFLALIKEQNEEDEDIVQGVTVTVHYGPGTTGKSTAAGKFRSRKDVFTVIGGSRQPDWNGYKGQKWLCIDDVDKHWSWEPSVIKTIIQPGAWNLNQKWEKFNTPKWEQVHITSNHPPSGWFKEVADGEAFMKRVFVYRYTSLGTPPILEHSPDVIYRVASSKGS